MTGKAEPDFGSAGALSSNSASGFESRAGGLYHPDACKTCDDHVATFETRLQTTAVNISKQDGVETVGSLHVTRAYDTLVAPRRRKRFTAIFCAATFGLTGGQAVNVIYDMSKATAAPSSDLLWLLVGCVLAAIAAGIGMAVAER